ncbi:hydroxyacylglutathione hydrolase [Cupriavidus gilardii]|uniref:hydroxyacylglutathione hydrolase n=1 Tax=Cupriavidus gilardii TaxID=82541 RepID=UPI001EE52C2C|nr:hydroxyacylglutathione hydrolase [Cupriavidus gilardii]MCG5261100.1 hydroxyacylglutathione hydrolase [Cupriavidus gilardii]MDF9432638.1 hydroxyacylglutathione hydrolase [Cupriavidus gilardii]
MLRVEPIPAFQDNYIWAIDDGNAAAVVDPGEAAPVLAYLARAGLVLGAIVITHHHGDHQGGVAELLAAYPTGPDGEPVPVIGPAAERIGHRTRAVREGDEVELKAPALRLRVLEVPGHTAGHIAYTGELPGIGPVVFCGDTMFASGCGRLFEGTPAQMLASLDKLAALPEATRVYCAHEYTRSNVRFARAVEPDNAALAAWEARVEALRAAGEPTVPTTVGHERAVNPFLRSREPSVRRALARQGATAQDDAAAFGALRAWKDGFR